MKSRFQSKNRELLEAYKVWNEKLKESGFTDIEDEFGGFTDHKSLSDLTQRVHFQPEIWEINRDYFSWAGEMLYRGNFKCERDRIIWELHSEGFTGAEISEVVKLERTWINRVVQNIRQYLQDEPEKAKENDPQSFQPTLFVWEKYLKQAK